MNKHHWARTALAVALLATLTLPLGQSARAAGSDASAIAGFLSIGFANASNNFGSIRGKKVDLAEYVALKWPDRTHFQSCHTWHFEADAALGMTETYMYSCNSTPRSGSPQTLFNMAAAAVRKNLPSAYTSGGPEKRKDGVPYQVWSLSGKPDVKLWSFANKGKPYYELSMEKKP